MVPVCEEGLRAVWWLGKEPWTRGHRPRSARQLCCFYSDKLCFPGPTLLLATTLLGRQPLEEGTFSYCSPSLWALYPCFLALGSSQN